MKRFILLTVVALATLLTGCATNYDAYAKAQTDIATAQSNAETARLLALAKIAEQGDATAKTAAVMALALTGTRGAVTQLQAPSDPALEWARILVPGMTNLAGIVVNAQVARHASDNAVRLQEITIGSIRDVAAEGIAAAGKVTIVETTPSTETTAP